MTQRHNRISLLILLVILIPSFSQASQRRRVGPLRVISTSDWYLGLSGTYHWISTETILYLRDVHADPPIYEKASDSIIVKRAHPYGGSIELYNITTGSTERLPGLSAAFEKEHGVVATIRVSPDGRWMYWVGDRGAAVSSLGGSQHLLTELRGNVEWANADTLAEFEVDGFGRVKKIYLQKVSAPYHIEAYPIILRVPHLIDSGVKITSDYHLLLSGLHLADDSDVSIIEKHFGPYAEIPRIYNVHWPKNYSVRELQFSSRGRSIGWLMAVQNPGRGTGLTNITRWELWISAINGKKKVMLSRQAANGNDVPHDLKWLPNSRHLSFIFQKKVYLVKTFPHAR